MPAPRIWTKHEIAVLGTMSDESAAKLIGCSRDSVIRKRLRLKIPSSYTSSERREVREKKWGMKLGRVDWGKVDWRRPNEEIAKLVNRTPQRIRSARAIYSPETAPAPAPRTPIDWDAARRMRGEGKTHAEIGAAFGITRQRVQQVLKGVAAPGKRRGRPPKAAKAG